MLSTCNYYKTFIDPFDVLITHAEFSILVWYFTDVVYTAIHGKQKPPFIYK